MPPGRDLIGDDVLWIVRNAFRTNPLRASASALGDTLDCMRLVNDQAIMSSDANFDPLFFERVEYFDLSNAGPPSDTSSPSTLSPSTPSRTLPLFLLGAPFFPQGTTYLNVFEMKYRTMMSNISKADETFGYIHTNSRTGEIASVGTICKVVDRQVLEDGRQNIALEGVGRFRVNKILNTLPYMVAEVEPFLMDAAAEEAEAAKVEKEVFCSLKYYLRLLRSYDKNSTMVVTQATKRNRPGQGLAIDDS
ncbi:PUA-like domain-containing protein, partial [Ochromonadaceae sp. CCMP2298]